jgi:hypothetical protein
VALSVKLKVVCCILYIRNKDVIICKTSCQVGWWELAWWLLSWWFLKQLYCFSIFPNILTQRYKNRFKCSKTGMYFFHWSLKTTSISDPKGQCLCVKYLVCSMERFNEVSLLECKYWRSLSSDVNNSCNRLLPDCRQHPLAAHHVAHATCMWEPNPGADRADGVYVSRWVNHIVHLCFRRTITLLIMWWFPVSDRLNCAIMVCYLLLAAVSRAWHKILSL